ncbi:MAG: YceI family protein [Candidatus Eremiobacteraeota bacterium]|nr:YceI family protein [Candidatus Eremiobacteraeota bacterium]
MTHYDIQPETQVEFDGKSSVHPIHAKATGVTGFFEAEIKDGAIAADPPPAMRFTVPVANIKSGNDMEDNEMRRLIGGPRYPNISAELKSLKSLGQNRYTMQGEITVRGQSRTYEGEVTCVADAPQLTLDGQRVFDMRDFGIQPPQILFLKVYPEVTVRLHLVAKSKG